MKKKLPFLFLFSLLLPFALPAQNVQNHAPIENRLQNIADRLQKINTVDPDLIPLHYFFILDIEKELDRIQKNDIPTLQTSLDSVARQLIEQYDLLSFKTQNFKTVLADQKKRVDVLYFREAERMLLLGFKDSAWYDLERALQYNPTQADALIMKAELQFEEEQYESCVETIHILYNESVLTREQEMAISDFTLKLYDRLYTTGDSLLHAGLESDALDLFKTLETFCHNMPSNYCNDDYYKGIMRSRAGIYQSFLKIAEIAQQRGNQDVATAFAEYARKYKEENENEFPIIETPIPETQPATPILPQLTVPDAVTIPDVPATLPDTLSKPLSDTLAEPFPETLADTLAPALSAPIPETTPVTTATPMPTVPNCNELIRQAIDALCQSEFEKATRLLQQAAALENCDCIPLDAMLREIENRQKK